MARMGAHLFLAGTNGSPRKEIAFLQQPFVNADLPWKGCSYTWNLPGINQVAVPVWQRKGGRDAILGNGQKTEELLEGEGNWRVSDFQKGTKRAYAG